MIISQQLQFSPDMENLEIWWACKFREINLQNTKTKIKHLTQNWGIGNGPISGTKSVSPREGVALKIQIVDEPTPDKEFVEQRV